MFGVANFYAFAHGPEALCFIVVRPSVCMRAFGRGHSPTGLLATYSWDYVDRTLFKLSERCDIFHQFRELQIINFRSLQTELSVKKAMTLYTEKHELIMHKI